MSDSKLDEKQFGLKDSEVRMLAGIQELYMQQLSLFLSFIALERLAYNVTINTQFRTEGNKIWIWESAPPEEPSADGVSTGNTPTSEALKGKKK